MTAVYNEDTLRTLYKTQLTELFLKSEKLTKGVISSLTKKMKNLNNKF